MLLHNRFTSEDWDSAPSYENSDSSGHVIVLDFPMLTSMAQEEEDKGAFRPEGKQDVLFVAPLYIGHLPAAFYRVQTERPESMGEYETTRKEILVIVDGVLKLVRDQDYMNRRKIADDHKMLYPGQVMKMEEELVNLEAVSVFSPANCLAVAIFADAEIVIGNPGLPRLGPPKV